MKYVKQLTIIMVVSFCGEIVHFLVPAPIPASIYGMVIMLIALMTGVIKVSSVRETAMFLIEIMPIMFLPSTTGILGRWPTIRQNLIPYIVLAIVPTIVVMVVGGHVTQFIMRRRGGTK